MATMISAQKRRLIEGAFLFRGIDEIVVEHIISDHRCTLMTYSKGDVIYDETSFSRSLGIVLSGCARVDKATAGGKYMKMSNLHPGECFGAAALFTDRDTFATRITATCYTEILFLAEDILRWAMRRDFKITENYIRYLSDRIHFLNEKITGLTAGSAEQRLALFLLSACGDSHTYSGLMTELSRQLHMGRATLYRAVDALADGGWILREGKALRIPDPEGMAEAFGLKSPDITP